MALERLERQLQKNINNLVMEVAQSRHRYLTLEHLLWALLDNTSASLSLKSLQVDVSSIRSMLQFYFDEYLSKSQPQVAVKSEDISFDAEMTLAFQRVISRAVQHVESLDAEADSERSRMLQVEGDLLLLYIFSEPESIAARVLMEHGLKKLDLTRYLSEKSHASGITPPVAEEEADVSAKPAAKATDDDREQKGEDAKKGALEKSPAAKYLSFLNAQAGNSDPLIGREQELKLLMGTLLRRRKNNPLLVGEAGVGKNALVEGLARAVVAGEVPQRMRDLEIYQLRLGALISGSRYRGDFEERLNTVVSFVQQRPQAVLFIDEMHSIVGAGGTSGSAVDAANLLKPALSSGQLRCIGATTFTEYRRFIEADPTLKRRFRKVELGEPTVEDCYRIISGLAANFERHHSVRFDPEALRSSVDLTSRYLPDSRLPDKAIDLIDEIGARRNLADNKNKRFIKSVDIAELVSELAQVPIKQIHSKAPERLARLEAQLKRKIFGQNQALDALTQAVQLAYAGLRPSDKSLGAFLLAGPTGVGKTEACRQLAAAMDIKLLRFDMSEYAEKHSISRLVGAPPGYVGYESGGLLTEAVHKHPHCLVLLDEIEKAHPDIYHLLLQIMDYGKLTDTNGRECRFQHSLLVMTTNLGAEELQKTSIGFQSDVQKGSDALQAINKHFSPEFRNRLDAILQFTALSPEAMRSVVDLRVQELKQLLREKSVELQVSSRAKLWLATAGYDQLLGARPLNRLIEQQIRVPLAQSMLFGDLRNGGRCSIGVRAGGLRLTLKSAVEVAV